MESLKGRYVYHQGFCKQLYPLPGSYVVSCITAFSATSLHHHYGRLSRVRNSTVDRKGRIKSESPGRESRLQRHIPDASDQPSVSDG